MMQKEDKSLNVHLKLAVIVVAVLGIVFISYSFKTTMRSHQLREALLEEQRENPYMNLTPFVENSWNVNDAFPKLIIHTFESVHANQLLLDQLTSEAQQFLVQLYPGCLDKEENKVIEVKTLLTVVNPSEHIGVQMLIYKDGQLIKEKYFVCPDPNFPQTKNWLDYWHSELIGLLKGPQEKVLYRDPYNEEGKGIL